jgi:hypothetical protein
MKSVLHYINDLSHDEERRQAHLEARTVVVQQDARDQGQFFHGLSSEVGQIAYLGIAEGSDPIRGVVDEPQIWRVFHAGCRHWVIHDAGTLETGGDGADLDLVGNADRQEPHQLPVAEIGDERDPGEPQQARRVGGRQSRAAEFPFYEVEVMFGRLRFGHFGRFRVLPLVNRPKNGVVTRATGRRRRFILCVGATMLFRSGRETPFGSHFRS